MNIGSSLSLRSLSRYAPTMSTWWMMRFKNRQTAKYIRSNSLLTVGAKVSAKSMPGICEKPYATSCALNLATDPSG